MGGGESWIRKEAPRHGYRVFEKVEFPEPREEVPMKWAHLFDIAWRKHRLSQCDGLMWERVGSATKMSGGSLVAARTQFVISPIPTGQSLRLCYPSELHTGFPSGLRSRRNDETVEEADAARALRGDILVVGGNDKSRPGALIDPLKQSDHLVG